ncbi:hypothetical protein [Arthrobacter sp. B1805]|uniref:hypothetical protein n=1 Tax=Arthrobacter sp. B1805 TaxID=2058892 RepID=UPI0015E45963|nr:hypothetical protein [Arthrobacter sp. B1805]
MSQGGPLSAYLSLRDVHGKVRKVLVSQDIVDRSHQLNEESQPHLRAQALRDLFPMT